MITEEQIYDFAATAEHSQNTKTNIKVASMVGWLDNLWAIVYLIPEEKPAFPIQSPPSFFINTQTGDVFRNAPSANNKVGNLVSKLSTRA